jgi:hypothetical protein
MMSYEACEKLVAAFLRERRDDIGGEYADPTTYYGALLRSGRSFFNYDRPIAHFLAEGSRVSRYVDVGSGIGTLPILIASMGMDAIGVERAHNRFEEMKLLFSRARVADPSARLTAICADFPSAEVPIVDYSTVIMFNCIITKCSLEHEDEMLAACRDARGIVMDLVRFTRARSSQSSWNSLIDRVCALGFASPIEICSWGPPTAESEPPALSCGRVVYFSNASPKIT